MKTLFSVLAAILASTLVINAQTKSDKPLRARDLLSAYESNEVLCDEKLKGHRLTVIGEIHNVGKDILGTPYVALKGGNDTFFTVQCMFTKADKESLMKLRSGQTVAISGIVKGKLMNVLLDECQIVP